MNFHELCSRWGQSSRLGLTLSKQIDVDRCSQRKHDKIVVFKAECLRELIRCMFANSCVAVLEVLTDDSDLRVERRSAGTDTKKR